MTPRFRWEIVSLSRTYELKVKYRSYAQTGTSAIAQGLLLSYRTNDTLKYNNSNTPSWSGPLTRTEYEYDLRNFNAGRLMLPGVPGSQAKGADGLEECKRPRRTKVRAFNTIGTSSRVLRAQQRGRAPCAWLR